MLNDNFERTMTKKENGGHSILQFIPCNYCRQWKILIISLAYVAHFALKLIISTFFPMPTTMKVPPWR